MTRLMMVALAVGLAAFVMPPPALAQAPADVLRVSIIGDVTLNPFTQPQQLPTS